MDFSANGRYLLVSYEYTGVVFRISTETMKITGTIHVGGLPIDVKVVARRQGLLRGEPGPSAASR